MRLIDADALKASFPKAQSDIFQNCRRCTCLDNEEIDTVIDSAPTVSGWVSVKDRLPEKNGLCLCRYEQEINGKVCRCIDFGMFDSDIGEKGGWFVEKVTHWMPIPEPPKEDDHEAL